MTNTTYAHNIPPQGGASVARAFLAGDTGQGLVELALTLPLFMLILLGSAEFARFAWATIETSNAARAGVQYGAQDHVTASKSALIQAAALNDGINLSGLTATPSHYCVCSSTGTASCSAPLTTSCPAPATLLEYVQVNTTSTVTPLYHWPGLPTTFTAQGSAIMEVEQ
jgi:Flp pilus assembly protein TadG